LGDAPNMPSKLIKLFFDTNRRYFSGSPKAMDVSELPPLEFEVRSYHSLINATSRSQADDRKTTIEIQTVDSIELKKNAMLIVLPSIFLDSPALIDVIVGKWKAKIKTYTLMNRDPAEYTSFLLQSVEAYLQENNLL